MDSDVTICYRNITFLIANVLVLQNRSKHKLSIKENSPQYCFKLLETTVMSSNYYPDSNSLSGYPDNTDICFSPTVATLMKG